MSFAQLMLASQHMGRIKRQYTPGLPPCPHCGLPSKAVETRLNRRRRVCEGGHSHHTIELPESVLRAYMAHERIEKARATLREKGYLCSE